MVYDAQNRRRTVTDRLSGVTTYALNAGGQLTALTDAESQTTSYTYNARGEKTEEEYPDHTSGSPGDATYGKILFAYDPAGRLSRRDDQNGDTVTHIYDMAGRLLQKDYRTRANSPTGTIADSDTFTYDRSSRMLTAVSGRYSNTVTNTYDFAGRLKDESLTIATKTYTVSRTYDSLGRLYQMTYPNSTVVERTYTDRNQLYTVKYGANIEDTRSYDDGGRLSTSAYRNGVTTTYNYRNVSGNKDSLLASIQFAHPGGTATNRQVGDLTYTWDANKNKTKETIAGTLSGYSFDTTLGADPDGYDDEDRITYFKRSNTTNPQTWTLTSVGDWSSWNNFSTTAETRTHGAAHELTRIGSGTTPATILYDTKGNITQNQRTPGTSSTYQNYVWDFDNRLISADTNGDSTADVTYEYDALGRRVARTQGATAVVYIHAGQQTVCDYTRGANANTTPAFRYVWGDYIDEPILRQTGSSTLLYYHHNQQYSTVAITSASGLVVTRFGYTAYGDQTIMSHTGASQTYATYSIRHTYTGREWDDSLNAHYFRARWYDAVLGRFVNRDPIGYVDGMSLYGGYFSVKDTDPLGTRKVCCKLGYESGGDKAWVRETQCDNFRSAAACCGELQGTVYRWRVIGAIDVPCNNTDNPVRANCACVAACAGAVAIPTDPTDAVGTPAGLIVGFCALGVLVCSAPVIVEFPPIDIPNLPDVDDMPGACEFYLAWCVWGTNPFNNDKGPIWKRWGGNKNDCLSCYAECKKTGVWPHARCLPNGKPEGPRWGDDVWPD